MSMWDDHDAHMLWLDRWGGSSNRNYNDAQGDGNYNNEDDADIFLLPIFLTKKAFLPPSDFPLDADPSKPGVSRGSCPR